MKNIKNIVWILTDSQHAEAVGYMGNKAVHTPNLDKLAAKSQIFTNAHCQYHKLWLARAAFRLAR